MKREEIELIFYKVIRNEVSSIEFEGWLYSADEEVINSYFGENFYFDLISINYRNKFVRDEVEKLIYSKIPFNKFEDMTLRFLLNNLINKTRDIAELLEIFYDLYCKGYYFLRFLGLTYVLYGIDEMPRLSEKKLWNDVSFIEKRETLDMLTPKLVNEAKRIIDFLDNDTIKITDEFKYLDLRKEEDKVELNNLEHMYEN